MNYLDDIREYAVRGSIDLYMVGGAVRDTIMGRAVDDYDFASGYDCHKIAKDMADMFNGSYVNMHKDVARVVAGKAIFDICNLKGKDIYEDLSKRDFTINSIGIDIKTAKIIDSCGGIEDMKNKTIRHTYEKAFDDDPVRLLRAVRLASSLGFEICGKTKEIVREKSYLLTRSAGERILDELYKILECENSHKYIVMLDELHLLEHIFPITVKMKEIGKCRYHVVDAYTHSLLTLSFFERMIKEVYRTKWGKSIENHFNEIISGRPRLSTVKMGAFLHDIGKPEAMREEEGRISFKSHDKTGEEELRKVAARLNMSNDQREIVKSIITGHMRILGLFKHGATNRAVYRLFKELGDNTVDVLISSLFDLIATRSLLEEKEEYLNYWDFIMDLIDRYYTSKEKDTDLLTGRDVINLTGASGREIGEILKKVDEQIFYGNIRTREEAVTFIKSLADVDNVEK